VPSCATAPNGQYCAEYFGNRTLSGAPVIVRNEPAPLSKDFGQGSPGTGVGSDNFSLRATGLFVFNAGSYVFTVRSDDGVRVWCNGSLAWSHAIHRPITPDADRFDITLHPGWNLLLVKVRNDDGGYSLSVRVCDPDAALKTATRRE